MGSLSRIVCGWHTPDYAHWADRLKINLNSLGELHDFVEVPKLSGGWERNTMRKPAMIRDALRRHPDRTIIFVDVDCEVLEPLTELAAIRGDIGIHFRCRTTWNGLPRFTARTGTIVVRQVGIARDFLVNWEHLNDTAALGSVDQRTLPMAIAQTPGLAVEMLDGRYCAVPDDEIKSPAILHDRASRAHLKVPQWMRTINHLIGNRTGSRPGSGGATRGKG